MKLCPSFDHIIANKWLRKDNKYSEKRLFSTDPEREPDTGYDTHSIITHLFLLVMQRLGSFSHHALCKD